MTDRDAFAAAALTGMLASPRALQIDGRPIDDAPAFARAAYSLADAMVAERRKREMEQHAQVNPLPPPNPDDRSTIKQGWLPWPWSRT